MPEHPSPEHSNPFPGLRPFRTDEDHLFFGREDQVDSMIDILARHRFLAVVGTSGGGKSSLVNCGLEPALHQGLMASAGSNWRIARFRPENRPIPNLARALADDGVLFSHADTEGLTLLELIESTLRLSTVGLLDIVEQASCNDGFRLLVVVDQFEELFRYRQLDAVAAPGATSFSEEASAFVSLLLAVLEAKQQQIHIVITMRSDFLGDCTQQPGLAEAINRSLYLVPRLTREERRAAIANPVLVAGATISPVLVTRLVNDVGDNPDQLSILQHALNRTWAHWAEEGAAGPLELGHYEAIGTMAEALDRHAEQAYAELADPEAQEGDSRLQIVCRHLFQAITDRASDGRGVRRPTKWYVLRAITQASDEELSQVLHVFRHPSRAFLMPPAGSPLEEESVIDISHESLMRVWRRLKHWGEEEAQAAQIYRRLAQTADLYAKGQAETLREPELTICRQWKQELQPTAAWAERYATGLEQALAFLQSSQDEFDAEEAQSAAEQKERERQQSDAAEQKRRVRLLLIGLSCALAGVVVTSISWILSWSLLQKATLASARANAASASALVDTDPFNALMHGLAALEHLENEPGDLLALGQTLEQGIDDNWLIGEFNAGHEVTSLAALRNGDLISGGADGTVQRWRSDQTVGAPIATHHQGAVTSLVELPNGDWISGGADGTLQRWRHGRPIDAPIKTGAGTVLSLVLLRNGDLLSGGFDGVIQRWRNGQKAGGPIATKHGAVFSLLELRNGDWISGGMDGTVQRWRDGQKLGEPIATGQGPVRSLAELPTGEWISGGFDGNLQRWRDGQKVDDPISTSHGEVRSLVSLRNGELVSGGRDRRMRHWQPGQASAAPPLTTIQGLTSLVQLRNGDLLSGDAKGNLQRWSHGRRVGGLITTKQGRVLSLLELSNGDWISGGSDGTVQRWRSGRRVGGLITTKQGQVLSLLELRNGDWISGGLNGDMQRWRHGKPIGGPIATGQGPVYSLLELDNGEWISGGRDGTLQRWSNGQKIGRSITTRIGGTISLIIRKNGDLISASSDGRLKLWRNEQAIFASACRELKSHPALREPKSETEHAARSACVKFVKF
ncbi:MAG: hypothetical protein VKO00_07635 [Cyanobacteriota bacterium]|nr:hypothetical protein [Cyanobacteriota bacterium]